MVGIRVSGGCARTYYPDYSIPKIKNYARKKHSHLSGVRTLLVSGAWRVRGLTHLELAI